MIWCLILSDFVNVLSFLIVVNLVWIFIFIFEIIFFKFVLIVGCNNVNVIFKFLSCLMLFSFDLVKWVIFKDLIFDIICLFFVIYLIIGVKWICLCFNNDWSILVLYLILDKLIWIFVMYYIFFFIGLFNLVFKYFFILFFIFIFNKVLIVIVDLNNIFFNFLVCGLLLLIVILIFLCIILNNFFFIILLYWLKWWINFVSWFWIIVCWNLVIIFLIVFVIRFLFVIFIWGIFCLSVFKFIWELFKLCIMNFIL